MSEMSLGLSQARLFKEVRSVGRHASVNVASNAGGLAVLFSCYKLPGVCLRLIR
jgi:hypothetical protein